MVVDVNARNVAHVGECGLIGTFCSNLNVCSKELICVFDVFGT
jgi:hypothetical protein